MNRRSCETPARLRNWSTCRETAEDENTARNGRRGNAHLSAAHWVDQDGASCVHSKDSKDSGVVSVIWPYIRNSASHSHRALAR
jgi:hypothetical protein